MTYADYIAFAERLRRAGFTEETGEQALTCRWRKDALILDVLALSREALGFTNMWYEPALRHAATVALPAGQSIRVITAPFFLGTKVEAFTSQAMDLWAYRNNVKIDFSRPGKPTDNAFVESFNGTFRSECLNTHWFADLREAKALIEAWRKEYNESRPHASLADRTPSEFASQYAASRILAETKNSRGLTSDLVQEN